MGLIESAMIYFGIMASRDGCHVVIVGAGFGGLNAALAFEDTGVRVTLAGVYCEGPEQKYK
jgi:NADPH-dependent 2,4-dienoyl-CoA reductase/sulfur reductase-like enzyme